MHRPLPVNTSSSLQGLREQLCAAVSDHSHTSWTFTTHSRAPWAISSDSVPTNANKWFVPGVQAEERQLRQRLWPLFQCRCSAWGNVQGQSAWLLLPFGQSASWR